MKKIYISLLLLTAVAISACKKELVEDARSQVTDEYLSTPEGFQTGVNAAYSYMREFYGLEIGGNLSVQGTDEYTAGSGADRDFTTYTSNMGPTKGNLTTVWNNSYIGINTCNALINRAPDIAGIDATLKNTRVAEARFLRSQYYFLLVQMFGAVHLTTTETKGAVTTAARAPVADVYKLIIEDLDFAIANLPVTSNNYGRAIKPAAEHALAKVYLTRAGIANDAADYTKAAELAKSVINNYTYRLLDNFSDVFAQGTGERNNEVIFSIQYSNNVLTNGMGNKTHLYFQSAYDVQPGMQRDLANGRPFSRFRPTPFNANLVYNNPADGRSDKTFKRVYFCNRPGTYAINGRQVTLKLGDTAIYMPPFEMTAAQIAAKNYSVFPPSRVSDTMYPALTKFLDPTRRDSNDEPGYRDFILFRLGETYLIAAEALLMSGKPAEAVPFINTLRRRAAKTGTIAAETAANKTAMEVTAAQLNIDFILDERMRELNGEHQRWYDLVRTKQLVNRVKLYNVLGAPNVKDFHMLRPIPQSQIDATDGGNSSFPQNPGY